MIPCVHRAHRGHQFLARRLLEQITESACLKSLENMFRGVIHREDQDTGVGSCLLFGVCGFVVFVFGFGVVFFVFCGLLLLCFFVFVVFVCGFVVFLVFGFCVLF